MITVEIVNQGTIEIEENMTLEMIAKQQLKGHEPMIVAAKVDNKLKELTYQVTQERRIEFIDLSHMDGIRIYQRGLTFLLIRSAKECFENLNLNLLHSLSKGLYFEVEYNRRLRQKDLRKIKERMIEIVKQDDPFEKIQVSKDEAKELYHKFNMESKEDLLDFRKLDYINLYRNDWLKDYFYGYMVPSTSYLRLFDLMLYDNGILLRHPTNFSPTTIPPFVESPQLGKIFKEYENWASILNCSYVSNLNEHIISGNAREIISLSEVLHSKKISKIADIITEQKKRVILISGPSSSGKTTFSKRLNIHLKVNGLNPITLSVDDYFVNRENTPLDENGEYDFETINAVDLELFNSQLNAMLQGDKVEIPRFNFQKGKREYKGDIIELNENQPIIIEGIHGLNPQLTKNIFEKDKFKIYASALTQLNIDIHNRIPTTDARLIRRIVRDNQFRGHDAKKTISLWDNVRKGEEKYIFPYQEDADIMFNSALMYELAILKKHVMPLLKEITRADEQYMEAVRLLKFLQYFESIDDDHLIPNDSILKEFIGGSVFDY